MGDDFDAQRMIIDQLRQNREQNRNDQMMAPNPQQSQGSSPTQQQTSPSSQQSSFDLGTAGKVASAMSGLSPGFGVVGGALSLADALRNPEPIGPRQVIGGIGQALGAAAPLSPIAGALGGAIKLGTGIYDSFQGGVLGDMFDTRPEEAAWDSLENYGYSRNDVKNIMGAKAPKSLKDYYAGGGEGPGSSGGSKDFGDRESKQGGMGGV